LLYISYGMAKSASSFAFQLAAGMANRITPQQKALARLPEGLSGSYQANLATHINAIEACVPVEDMLVIKTHDPLNQHILERIRSGHFLASITIRDPYDIVVSLLDSGRRERRKPEAGQRPYFAEIHQLEDALRRVPSHMKCAEEWIAHAGHLPHCEIIRYDELRTEPYAVADRIAVQMGIRNGAREVVDGYLADRSKIWEYNKGESGRGHTEIEVPKLHPMRAWMDNFVNKHLS
jgi:hypothetical protein